MDGVVFAFVFHSLGSQRGAEGYAPSRMIQWVLIEWIALEPAFNFFTYDVEAASWLA